MGDAMAQMQKMMQGMGGRGGFPGGPAMGGMGGKDMQAQMKAAMDMLAQIQKNSRK